MLNEEQIIGKLKSLIGSIVTDEAETKLFKQVSDFIPAQWVKFPACYILPQSWNEEYIDLRDTLVSATFTIGIVFTLTPNAEEGQRQIRDAVSLVRAELGKQENIKLDGLVDWSKLTSGNYTFDVKEQKMALCVINYSAQKRYNRINC